MTKTRKRRAWFFTLGAVALLAAAIICDTRAGGMQQLLQRAYLRDRDRSAMGTRWRQYSGEVRTLEEKAMMFYFGAALGGLFGLISWLRPSLLERRAKATVEVVKDLPTT